ncbi:MAG: rRNA pseudouridine synthase, partial [Phaeodactylibacter sp.]|nr:rRNA pseudouridine synthase [Phaeodactylibacter sp.]MCB9264800.1 rRNA pseudouridine synthase [Lewinellaceae bacterium]MCB9286362.1 rRNA pseudouridine synthase [Lewinellaceae bacterium]
MPKPPGKNNRYRKGSPKSRPGKKRIPRPKDREARPLPNEQEVEGMRLNKYVAHCGICSRRQAAEYVKQGEVSVNGEKITEPGYQVKEGDQVAFRGKPIRPEKKLVYILLNKPKDYITTVKDDRGRRTVLDLLGGRIEERIFPVGRLDRATTGLLLLTNDGELAEKLAHPSNKVNKLYHVVLDTPLSTADLEKIRNGLKLEDGKATVDAVDYVQGKKKNEIGIELHIGRNRIVRRIFEHLGYKVVRLDRVYYAGLTKKDLPRGRWRHLEEKEVIMLKHFT